MPLLLRAPALMGNAALLLAIGSVGAALLAFGAVHASWMAAVAALAHTALLLHVADRARRRRSLTTSWIALPLVLGLLFTLFQLTPLPTALRELLSPTATERLLFVTAALPAEARALVRPVLTLDPPETALAALRLSSALCVFVVLADRCRKREGRRLAFFGLLFFGVALVLISFGHWLLALRDIYGVLHGYGGYFSSPLVNPNHGARAFGALSLLLVGRACLARVRLEAAAFAVVGALLGLCTLLIPSRGGTLAYIASFGALLWLTARARRRERAENEGRPRRRELPARAVAAVQLLGLGLVSVLFVAGKEILEQIFPTDVTDLASQGKFVFYRPTFRAVQEYWRAGAGNNAFQTALPPLMQPGELPVLGTVTHPENTVLQVIVDHGVVLGAVILFGALLVATTLCARSTRPTAVPGLATLGFLVLGDLVDFSLEVGFGILLAATALALCAAALLSKESTVVRLRLSLALPMVGLLAVVASVTAFTAVSGDRFATDRALASVAGDERRAALHTALALHPSDSHYAYALAVDARRRRDLRGALTWANAAMILWPGHPGAHTEAARALAALGYLDQALLEYRLAWQSGDSRGSLLKEVAQRTNDVALRRQAVPANAPDALAAVCRQLVVEKRFDDADVCLGDAARMDGASEAIWLDWIRAALRREDAVAAQKRVRLRVGDHSADGELASLAAQADAFLRGPRAALDASRFVASAAREPVPLQKWRLQIALTLEDRDEARDILQHLRKHLRDPRDRDWLDRQEARLLADLGESAEALDRWRRVSRRAPRDLTAVIAQGNLELKLNLVDEAERTWTRARALAKDNRNVQQLGDAIADAQERKREARLRGLLDRTRDDDDDRR